MSEEVIVVLKVVMVASIQICCHKNCYNCCRDQNY